VGWGGGEWGKWGSGRGDLAVEIERVGGVQDGPPRDEAPLVAAQRRLLAVKRRFALNAAYEQEAPLGHIPQHI